MMVKHNSLHMVYGNPTQHMTGPYGDVLGLFNHVGYNIAANSVSTLGFGYFSNVTKKPSKFLKKI